MTTQKKRRKHTRRIGGDPTNQPQGFLKMFSVFTSPTSIQENKKKYRPSTVSSKMVKGFSTLVNRFSKKENNSPKKSIINSLRRKPIHSTRKTRSIIKSKLNTIQETSNENEENMSTRSPSSTRSSTRSPSSPRSPPRSPPKSPPRSPPKSPPKKKEHRKGYSRYDISNKHNTPSIKRMYSRIV